MEGYFDEIIPFFIMPIIFINFPAVILMLNNRTQQE